VSPERLVTMANRIAGFFAAYPRREEAVEGVATHLVKFWAPQMRGDLLALADTGGADALHPLVREALPRLRGP
jgi:formate dehydrogenase subunit delta